MAASAWAFFNSFRENLGGATAWDLAGTSDGYYIDNVLCAPYDLSINLFNRFAHSAGPRMRDEGSVG